MKRFLFTVLALFAMVAIVPAVAMAAGVHPAVVHQVLLPGSILGALGFALVGSVNDKIQNDPNAQLAPNATVIAQLGNAIRDLAYLAVNRPAWQVAAAAVAPPLLATATVTTQVKSTNTTQMMLNGVLTSLTATDPLLLAADFAAGDPVGIAIGFVRKYQVCWDGTSATTKITARPSDTHSIAASPLGTAASALAQCRWATLPPTGTVIVGVLSVANITNAFVPGTTLLGATGVTATYVDGPTQDCLESTPVTP